MNKTLVTEFTFYYIYIKTPLFPSSTLSYALFTFYYIYIKTNYYMDIQHYIHNLHSTIFILKLIDEVENSSSNDIYILLYLY